ncbi:hypothetical protein [Vibrio aestuarianus]
MAQEFGKQCHPDSIYDLLEHMGFSQITPALNTLSNLRKYRTILKNSNSK